MSKPKRSIMPIEELPDYYFKNLRIVRRSPFKTGQVYTSNKAAKYICSKCGEDKFQVGCDSYYTVIRCPTCKWEECIHDG